MRKKFLTEVTYKNGKIVRAEVKNATFFAGTVETVEFKTGEKFHTGLDQVEISLLPEAKVHLGEQLVTPKTTEGLPICEGDMIVHGNLDLETDKELTSFIVSGDYEEGLLKIISGSQYIQLEKLVKSSIKIGDGATRES